VLEALVEIRLMYLDEITIEFCFADDQPSSMAESPRAYQYA
jgi:hypothetical protein